MSLFVSVCFGSKIMSLFVSLNVFASCLFSGLRLSVCLCAVSCCLIESVTLWFGLWYFILIAVYIL